MASWLVRRDGKTMGPVTVEFLRQKAAAGQLLPTDEIKQQGRTDWVLCGTVKGLFPRTTPPVASGAGVTPPLPPRVGQPPAGGTASPPTVGAEVARKEAYARFLPRLAAFLLDSLIVFYLPVFVLGILAGLTVPFLGVAAVGIGPIEIVGVIFQLVLPLLAAAYFVAFESSSKQATWGKQLVGLRVEGIRGEQISVGKALGRYVSKGLSHLTFGLVFFMPLFTKRRQAMHDLMAATVVVDDDA